jgi:hypothetical protein
MTKNEQLGLEEIREIGIKLSCELQSSKLELKREKS